MFAALTLHKMKKKRKEKKNDVNKYVSYDKVHISAGFGSNFGDSVRVVNVPDWGLNFAHKKREIS